MEKVGLYCGACAGTRFKVVCVPDAYYLGVWEDVYECKDCGSQMMPKNLYREDRNFGDQDENNEECEINNLPL